MRNHSATTSTNADSFRRLEVITGVGRRRRWTDEEKARIVAESLDPATTSSAVARRYGLHAEPALCLAAAAATDARRHATAARVRAGAAGGGRPGTGRGGGPDGDCARPGGGAGRRRCGRRGAAAGARGGAGPGVIAVPPGVRILLGGAAGRLPQGHGWPGRPGAAGAAGRPVRGRGLHLPPQARRPGEDPGLRRDRPGPVQQEAGGRAVQLALAGGRRGPPERGASSRRCSRACRGTGCSPARSLARARHGERKCWPSWLCSQ